MLERPRRIAAIDLGSNSFHMTLAEVGEHGIKTYHREKHKVRLASGLGSDNQLSQEAIKRALDTLGVFGQILKDFKPDHVRAVGTFTFRTANNIEQLTQPAFRVLPYPIDILSGTEEARLIFQGVTNDQHLNQDCLVIDIGGGSTELIIGQAATAKLLHSCNMGCVSLTERYFADGIITAKAFEQATLYCGQQLESVRVRYLAHGWQHVIGSSGTIKALSLCAKAMGLSGGELNSRVLDTIKRQLLSASTTANIDLPGLPEDRVGVICGGLAALIAVFDLLDIDHLSYSDAALREGLLLETQERLQHHDNRHHSVELLARRFSYDPQQAQRVTHTANVILKAVSPSWSLDHDDYVNLLIWACQLHEVGHQINHLSYHKHAAYIVSNADMAGFNHELQEMLAFALLSQRKNLKLAQKPTLHLYSFHKTLQIILILRLAVRLNQFRQSNATDSFDVSANKDEIKLTFRPVWHKRQRLFSADLDAEREQFKPLGLNLDYEFLA